MRLRVRGPSGVHTISLLDSATVSELQHAISENTGLPAFDLKCGYPPRPLDLTEFDSQTKLGDTGLRLDGEQLIAVARDIGSQLKHPLQQATPAPNEVKALPGSKFSPQSPPNSQSDASQSRHRHSQPMPDKPLSLTRKNMNLDQDPPEVPVPSHQGTLVLRVMPDDNSCLFRAVGSAVLGDSLDSMTELRSLVAQGIQAQPDLYSEAVLQQPPDKYCQWIQHPDSWGGGIELGILSEQFDVEVCSINVQDLRVDRFNEGKSKRIILVYSGIHYDTIALSPSEPPHAHADLPAELDIKQFDGWDEEVLEKAKDLCRILQKRHYYTDTAGFSIKCNTCNWQGSGERGATQHAMETGHTKWLTMS